MTTTDQLRDYLRFAYTADTGAHVRAWGALDEEDRNLVLDYANRFDTHSTINSGLLADLTDAIYGKGAAEKRGYPRGMVAKVRRVFNLLRRRKALLRRHPHNWSSHLETCLLKEVK